MRRSRTLLLAASLTVVGALAMFAFRSPQHLIEPELLRVQGFSDAPADKYTPVPTPCIILRIAKAHYPFIILAQDQVIQFRVNGEWMAPEKLDGSFLVEGGSGEPLPGEVVDLPNRRQAEAFRWNLSYRRMTSREAAITWLNH